MRYLLMFSIVGILAVLVIVRILWQVSPILAILVAASAVLTVASIVKARSYERNEDAQR